MIAIEMAYREFVDPESRHWKVWDVYPSLAERRSRAAGPPAGVRERRRRVEQRLRVHPHMAGGWLTFEARDGERRRLAPIPRVAGGWSIVSDEQLRTWCSSAAPAPSSRRLIE